MEQTKSVILPDLIKGLPDGVLRAWIAACSTGEEAYSLAIAFKEALEVQT
jgi:two-component system CheB/CheR fusion protein